ncbi:acyltransferase [Micromonospora matsumotoense]|uniref:acyltransferase family protein n=1 Tax=Micromonospora matsumotoense TaxID=121616 RepID=UPI0033CF0BEA
MSAPIPDQVLRRLPALDAVRVIGALAVVGHHVGFATGRNTGDAAVGAWLSRLDVGVAVFFVLSGFLLFRPYAHARATGQRPPATGRYLWRRAARILPAYWVAVVVCLLVLPQNRPASTGDWLRHLTLTQIYQHGQLRHGLSQTWSLATEVTFYLLLPVLAILLLGRRRPVPTTPTSARPDGVLRIALAATAVTGGWVALMGLGVLSLGLHTMWLPSYAGWFGAGMALAGAHVALRTGRGERWRWLDDLGRAPLACWTIALGTLAVATTPVTGPRDLAEPTAGQFATKLVLYLVVAVLLLVPVAFGPQTRTKGVFDSVVGRWLGRVSYGLFLWHPFVLEGIYLVDGRPEFTGDPLGTFALTVVGGLVLAAVSYYAVERPFQRWGGRWPRRRSTSESQSRVAVATAAS